MERYYYAYILSSATGTLYVGVTNDLVRRVWQHKKKEVEGFTKRYNITDLVYYEVFTDVRDAIAREKQIKGWNRVKKLALISAMNPFWRDLYPEIAPEAGEPEIRDSSQARNDIADVGPDSEGGC